MTLPTDAPRDPLAQRRATLARLREEPFDLVVVGGGITGAAVARDALVRGYRVALIERTDYGFGTSSRSSRLVHGGLRYLEHGQVALVFESLDERARLARLARHLVRPLPFLFPVYRGDERRLLTVRLGFWAYDALALFRNYRFHRTLPASRVVESMPGLCVEDLKGGVLYYDYQTDDARLVLENALAAHALGGAVLSQVEAKSFDFAHGRVRSVEVQDRLSGEVFAVRATAVVCAAGPWTDELLGRAGESRRWLRPTKGVHIVVPRARLPVDEALVMRHPDDRRLHFVLPYHEHTVVGTTDTDFHDDPAHVAATAADVRYLFTSVARYFPAVTLRPEEVVSSWAGVRPLLDQDPGADPSALSREHRIQVRPDGLVVIAGGKLTTFRRMAAECVDAASRAIAAGGGPSHRRGAGTRELFLPGGVGLTSDEELAALQARLAESAGDPQVGAHLGLLYGARAPEVLALAGTHPRLGRRIAEDLPYLWAEVAFAGREEFACTLSDVLVRRTQLFYRDSEQGLGVAEEAAELLAPILGWDPSEQARQVAAYRALVAENRAWREEIAPPVRGSAALSA